MSVFTNPRKCAQQKLSYSQSAFEVDIKNIQAKRPVRKPAEKKQPQKIPGLVWYQ
jgi:hypothetical protein